MTWYSRQRAATRGQRRAGAAAGTSARRYASRAGLFDLGLAITVAPLTQTAMSSAPTVHAGAASAADNDVAGVAGLIAVPAVPPVMAGIGGTSYLHPDELAAGFRTAVLVAAFPCAAGGALDALAITNPGRSPRQPGGIEPAECHYCALDAPPLQVER